MSGKLIPVDFACNDPDNGLFAGKVCAAQIDGNEVERASEVRFTETETGFRLHRREYIAEERKEWFGNWCWNRFWLPVREANRLAEHLRANGWRCTCGDTRFRQFMNGEAV